jgi:outer membrane receptor protein involved in Fe transport
MKTQNLFKNYTSMRHFFVALFSFFVFVNAQAQAPTSIQILDVESNTPVYAVAMIVVGSDTTKILTDDDGFIKFSKATPYKIVVNTLGYEPYEIMVQKDLVMPSIKLKPTSIMMSTAVVTGSKYERPLTEATVSLEVIRPDMLRSINANTPEKALDKLPGVNMLEGQPNIRGGAGWSYGAGSRVLVLLDDVPALQADAGLTNWGDLPIENTGQIEVLKGAGSALYGSSAMNGIINLRTAYATSTPETRIASWVTGYGAPADKAKQWWAADTAVTPMQTGMSLQHKQKFGKLDVVASTFFQWDQSYRATNWSRRGRVSANLRYRFSDRLSAGVQVNVNKGISSSYFYWKNDSTGAYLPSSVATANNTSSTRYFIDPSLNYYTKKGDRHRILGRIYAVTNAANAGRSNKNQYFYAEYQYMKNFGTKGVLTAGVVGSGNAISAELYGDTTFYGRNIGAYTQLSWKISDRWILEGGARWEQNTIVRPDIVAADTVVGGLKRESRPVFRVATNYKVGKATFLRASWGQGYRYPTVAELFIKTSVGFEVLPNPSLNSEHGWTSEFGVKQVVKLGNWVGFADGSVFWSRYFDMMEFGFVNSSFAFQSRNVGDIDIKGIEVSLIGAGKLGRIPLQTLIGYTYIDPTYSSAEDFANASTTTAQNVLKYRFQHVFKSDVQCTFGPMDFGASYNYNSEMVNVDAFFEFAIAGVRSFRENHKGYGLLDLRAVYGLTKYWKLSLVANNVLNEEYTHRPALLEAPRSLSFRVERLF